LFFLRLSLSCWTRQGMRNWSSQTKSLVTLLSEKDNGSDSLERETPETTECRLNTPLFVLW
jgi:hypothetical protein